MILGPDVIYLHGKKCKHYKFRPSFSAGVTLLAYLKYVCFFNVFSFEYYGLTFASELWARIMVAHSVSSYKLKK